VAFQVLGDRRWCEGAGVTSEDMIGQIARYVRHKCEISSGGVWTASPSTVAMQRGRRPSLIDCLRPCKARSVRSSGLWHRRLVQPRSLAVAMGPHEPRGYYLGAFDIKHQDADPLNSFGPGGSRRHRLARFDYLAGEGFESVAHTADEPFVFLVDGVILLRPELADTWDLSIYVHLAPEASLRRSVAWDSLLMGGTETATDEISMSAEQRPGPNEGPPRRTS
jgi:hypothetical protein